MRTEEEVKAFIMKGLSEEVAFLSWVEWSGVLVKVVFLLRAGELFDCLIWIEMLKGTTGFYTATARALSTIIGKRRDRSDPTRRVPAVY